MSKATAIKSRERDGRRSGLFRERGHRPLLRAALLVGPPPHRGLRPAHLDPLLPRVRNQVDAHVPGEELRRHSLFENDQFD